MGRIAVLGAVVAVVLAGPTLGTQARSGDTEPIAFVAGGVTPKQLPRRERVPAEFWISGDLRLVTAGVPPALQEIVLETDRAGRLDATGLPACARWRLRSMDRVAVEAACRDAIVGSGVGEAVIAYPENSPMPVTSDLLVVNGGVKERIATFFIWGAISVPREEAVIATVKIEAVGQGRYGLRSTVKIPPIADGHGSVTAFSARFKKRYGHEGKRRSAVNARCYDGKLQARVTMGFVDESKLSAVALSTCGIKR